MHSSAVRSRLSRFFLVTVFFLGLTGWAGTAPVQAHSQLISSSPADGATVAALPETASLTFNEEVNPNFAQLIAVGRSGKPVSLQPSTTGAVVSTALPRDLGDGKIVLRYKVVSKDGHPIGGEISFTVGEAGGSSSQPSTGASAAATQPSGRATTAAGSPSGSDGASTAAYALTGAAVVVLGLIAAVVLWWEKRRR